MSRTTRTGAAPTAPTTRRRGRGTDDRDGPFAARDPNDLGDDDAELDDAFPLGDGVAERAAVVYCPYCGEPSEVAVDPGGGRTRSTSRTARCAAGRGA
jgi:hypothetical protein